MQLPSIILTTILTSALLPLVEAAVLAELGAAGRELKSCNDAGSRKPTDQAKSLVMLLLILQELQQAN